jgi:hypothetical protein
VNPYQGTPIVPVAVGQYQGTCQQNGLQFLIRASGQAGTVWGVDAAFAFHYPHPIAGAPALNAISISARAHGREL